MKTALPVWDAPDGWPAGSVAYLLNKPFQSERMNHFLVIATTYQEPYSEDPDVFRPVSAVYAPDGEILHWVQGRACHETALNAMGYKLVDHAEGKNA
jgi:hypothetical protein